jgi:hypothetical protein
MISLEIELKHQLDFPSERGNAGFQQSLGFAVTISRHAIQGPSDGLPDIADH